VAHITGDAKTIDMDTKDFSALIGSFYTAALEPDRWSETAAQMAGFFGSESTAIQLRVGDFDDIAWRVTTANYDHTAQQEYAAYFHKLDPFANAIRANGRPGIFAGHELVDPDAFRRSEVYNDYCRRIGIFHSLGAGLDLGGTMKLMLGIHRPIEREDFGPEHRKSLEIVLPHLSRAVQMSSLLVAVGMQQRLAREMFGAFAVGAIIVDAVGKVIYANHVADRLLASDDGLTLRQARLTARDPKQGASLLRAIAAASHIASGGMTPPDDVLLVERAHKRPLSVLVAPFQRDGRSGCLPHASAIVFVSDPDARRPPASAALISLYKLTPAEARLLEALLQGERLAEYSGRTGISTNTANTQLKQIFAKTGTNRQADLTRQAFSDPIVSLYGRGHGR
jgi:DNA-binding CsgD family transcriptional regulator